MTIDHTLCILSLILGVALAFKWDCYKTRITVEKILREIEETRKEVINNETHNISTTTRKNG